MEPITIDELRAIIKDIADVVRGVQEKIFVRNLSVNITVGRANEMLKELCLVLKHHKVEEMIINDNLTLRDLIKTAFAEVGIEIEFSGRDKHEKAVIIDADYDIAASLNLAVNVLMPGQTVVRVAPL